MPPVGHFSPINYVLLLHMGAIIHIKESNQRSQGLEIFKVFWEIPILSLVYVCVVHMGTHAYVCICMLRSEVNFRCLLFLRNHLPLLLRQCLTDACWPVSPGCLYLSSPEITRKLLLCSKHFIDWAVPQRFQISALKSSWERTLRGSICPFTQPPALYNLCWNWGLQLVKNVFSVSVCDASWQKGTAGSMSPCPVTVSFIFLWHEESVF